MAIYFGIDPGKSGSVSAIWDDGTPWDGSPCKLDGTGKDIADKMEEWFHSPACDGFVISANTVPGTYEDFVKYVLPELQRRGLHYKDYPGATLRENLGLPYPEIGAWRRDR